MKTVKAIALFLFVGLTSAICYPKKIKVFKPQQTQEIPFEEKLPIVFHPGYDIGFFGIEKLHPFDSKKYGKVAKHLMKELHLSLGHFYKPNEVSQQDLKKVHTQGYLDALHSSANVAKITEVLLVAFLPNFFVQRNLLKPMRLATQGTIDAAQLALKNGVGINLGGGYHHAKAKSGGGFCVYADIPLAIIKLREDNPNLKVMYIDLDAHQGNGVESCLMDDKNTYIFDCYNEKNYPCDRIVASRINKAMTSESIYCQTCTVPLHLKDNEGFTKRPPCNCNQTYLDNLKKFLKETLVEFQQIHGKKPDIIFYNAGTDCFHEDPIGRMKLTKQSIIDRDQFIFQQAKENHIPLCMTLSGGYSQRSAEIIGDSLVNLWHQKLLEMKISN